MTEETAQKLTKLVLLCLAVLLCVMAAVVYQGYNGRQELVDAQRRACERGKLDRAANAKGWRTAQARALSQGQPEFAQTYSDIASGQERRSRIDCHKAFHDASIIP